uniref:WAP domain-containing protein n=1 Tax=Laticauda laticaudata TaxID=8630 RepID=A0A8C5SFZ6_LATLA
EAFQECTTSPTSLSAEKPGVCPKASPDLITICPVKCGSDWECHGKQKCCPYGCMVDCMDPV